METYLVTIELEVKVKNEGEIDEVTQNYLKEILEDEALEFSYEKL